MKQYVISAHHGIELKTGRVRLDQKQAERRKGKVVPVEGQPGVYEIISPTMFKNGEKLGYDGTISKAMISELVDEETAKKQEEEKKEKSPKSATAAAPASDAKPAPAQKKSLLDRIAGA